MKTITFDIEDGHVTITTTGFAGAACHQATAEVERQLGTVTERTNTSEFYKPAEQLLRVRG